MINKIVKEKDIAVLLKGAVHLNDKDSVVLLPEQCAVCPEAITGEGTILKKSGIIPQLTEVPANTVWYTDGSLDSTNVWGWHEDTFESFISDQKYKHCNSIYIGEGVQSIGNCNDSDHAVYIHLPESVNLISTYTFTNSRSLRVIDMPSKVEYIGSGVFANCYNLKSICVPEGVTELAYGPNGFFAECRALEEVMLPETLLSIGDEAFFNCSSLTSITIPNSVTSIGRLAFCNCTALTSITIPNSVTSIGDSAFFDCSSLTSITIPNSVTSIGNQAFVGCSGLTSITIPNSITSIGDQAFLSCSALTSITIPNSVTSIGWQAFWNCSGLTSVTLGSGVTSIEDEAFSDTPLNNVIYTGTTTLFEKFIDIFKPHLDLHYVECSDGTVDLGEITYTYADGTEITHNYIQRPPALGMPLTQAVIHDSTTSISSNYTPLIYDKFLDYLRFGKQFNTLVSAPGLVCNTTVDTLSWGITNYPDLPDQWYVFDEITRLNVSNFVFEDSVKIIPAYLCYNMKKLTDIIIPDNVEEIHNYAFSQCTSINNVHLGKKVSVLGAEAFSGVSTNVLSITVDPENKQYDSRDNCNAIIETHTDSLVLGCLNTIIPSSVKQIASRAFLNAPISSIQLPYGITHIGRYSFSFTNLTAVNLPETIVEVAERAFNNCSLLRNISTNLGTFSSDSTGNLTISYQTPNGETKSVTFEGCYKS